MPEAHPPPKAWCPTTKEQGLAGSEAPRPTCRRPIRPQRRGAPRRRNKGSRGAEHHVRSAGGSTTQAEPRTHPRPKAHPVPSRPRTPGRRLSKPATASPLGPETEKSEPVARAWCRIPRRPEAPAGRHPHPAPPGRSLIQIGARPAGRSAHLRPAPGSAATAKPVNQKTGAARGQSLFYLHL